MSSISNILSQFPDFQQLSSNTPFAVRTQQFQAQAQTSTTSNFSFTTAEGDRVSLSSGSESHFSFESYNFQGLAEGQAVDFRSQQLSTSARSDFSLLIEGDLNEQELADIQAFLQSSKGILQEIAAGNIENATEAALSLGDLNSLSSAALFFRQETTVSLQTRSTELSSTRNEASQQTRGRGIAPGQGLTIENALERIRKAQEQFQIDSDTLSKRSPTLLSTLIETLNKPSSEEESPQSLFEQIRNEFLQSLLQAAQNLKTDEETPEELAVEADKLNPATPAPPPTVQNGDILTNLLDESEVS